MSSKATNQTDSARPLILLVFLGLCWSLRLLAIKHTADSGAKPIDIALVATLAIVVLLLVINLARSRSLPKTSEHLKFYGLAGIFGFGAPFLAEATVAAHLPALVFVIIIATTPILTLLLSVVMRIERSSLIRVLGTLIGFLAVAVVIFTTQTNGRANDQPVQAFWIVAAFSIPLLYALYLEPIRKQ